MQTLSFSTSTLASKQELSGSIGHRIIRLKDVLALTGLSKAAIYDRLKPTSPRFDPSFPKQIKLSTSPSANAAVGWLESDVLAWLEKCRSA